MENYHFLQNTSPTPTQFSSSTLQKDIVDQLNAINVETLIFINQSHSEVDSPNKSKNIKTQIYLRRASIQESQQSSFVSNQVDEIKEQIEQTKEINQMKRTMKRSQTCFRKDYQQMKNPTCKIFLKKANQAIITHFETLKRQKSNFTSKILHGSKQYLRTIQVKYFRTNLSKVLFIDRNMTAIEFIGVALKEFRIEKKFDQSLYEYVNFTLAYQLETLEDQMEMEDEKFRKPIQRTKSFASRDESEIAQRRASYEDRAMTSQLDFSYAEIEDKTITIDYPAILNCKQVELVLNSSCYETFGIDLPIVAKTLEIQPNHIVILVEDAQTKVKQYLTCLPTENVQNLFEQLNCANSQKKSASDYILRLKYPCIHHDDITPLSFQTPINALPIHWLVVECKYTQEQSLTHQMINLSNRLSRQNEDGIVSQNYLTDQQIKADSRSYFSQIYTYQEFHLELRKKSHLYPILLGIDYFDLRIQYLAQESYTNNNSILQYFKKLFEDLLFKTEKKDKILSLEQITSVSQDTRQCKIHIHYTNSTLKQKILCLTYSENSDKLKQSKLQRDFQEAYQKLSKLVRIRKDDINMLK